jgi:hypothetical protein
MAGGVAQVVDHLHSNHKALSSNTVPPKHFGKNNYKYFYVLYSNENIKCYPSQYIVQFWVFCQLNISENHKFHESATCFFGSILFKVDPIDQCGPL